MYRNRIYIWCTVLVIYLLINIIPNVNVSSLLIEKNKVTIDINADMYIKNALAETRTISLEQTNNDADILLYKSKDEKTVDGYEKISNVIFSPIVLCVPVDMSKPSDLFYTISDDVNVVNFKNIVNAILEDKTLSELGISSESSYINAEELKNKKIILNIPSEGTFYYDEVINEIYIALNNNEIPTEEEKEQLKPTVDKLLEKSVECNDINKKIEEERDNEDKNYNIFITPEFNINTNNFGSTTGSWKYSPVYFEKSTIISYDIFYKNDVTINDTSLKDIIYDNIINNKSFSSDSYYRTSADLDYSSAFVNNSVNNNINIVK